MTRKTCKLANIAKMGPNATQGEHLIKILGQMWKLANITKMSLSEDHQQYLLKIMGQFWKLGKSPK